MENDKTIAVKTVGGPKAAVATFVRPSDNQRIYVFTRPRESVDNAIRRVKQRNGASTTDHQLVG
jgi:shikimate 5-dehydrogenase